MLSTRDTPTGTLPDSFLSDADRRDRKKVRYTDTVAVSVNQLFP